TARVTQSRTTATMSRSSGSRSAISGAAIALAPSLSGFAGMAIIPDPAAVAAGQVQDARVSTGIHPRVDERRALAGERGGQRRRELLRAGGTGGRRAP